MAVTQTIQDQVTELYVGFFGRAPDAVGMGYWAEKLGAGTATVYSIANEFSKTPEFISNYGGLTPAQQVGRIYQNVLNRAPDAGGEAYWVGQLAAGTPIGSVVYNIVNAAFQQVGTADGLLVQNKVTVGEYFALTLASNDTAVAKTAYNGVTSVASSVVAAEAALAQAVAPTYTLTTNIETVPANGTLPMYAKVTGVINGAANSTFQTGDAINGTVNGHNEVNVTVAAANASMVALNNVGSVNYRTLAAGQVENAQLFSGVGTVRSTGSNAILTVNNGEIASTYAVANSIAQAADGIAVGIRAGDVVGANTTAQFSVAAVGSANTAGAGNASNQVNSALSTTVTGIEKITLATTGNNFVTFTGNVAAVTDSASLTITGAGNNTITIANGGMATTSTIDASAATGTLALTVGTNLTTGDTITGTAGTADSLRATVSGTVATGLAVTGFETFRVDSGAAATLAFATNAGFTAVRVDDAAGGANGIRTLINGGGFGALNYVGTGTTAANANAMTFSGVTATGGWTGAADALAISFANGGIALTNAAPYTVGAAITVNGVENATISVADASATATTTLTGLNSNTLNTLTVVSNGAVAAGVVDTALVNSAAIASINFSGVTGSTVQSSITVGGTVANILAAASTITAGAGGLAVNMAQAESATDVLTFTGGAGVDVFDNGAAGNSFYTGNIVANLGGGADVLRAGNSASAQVNGGSGNDIIITGGGVDNITGGTGADAMTGGAGADTYSYGTLASVASQTGVTLAASDTITGFVTGTDFIQTGVAGTVLNYAEAGVSANYATALVLANVAMAAGNTYFLTDTVADGGLLFVDSNTDGTADALIKLAGVTAATFDAADIIA